MVSLSRCVQRGVISDFRKKSKHKTYVRSDLRVKNDALPYEKVRAIQVKKNKPLSQLIAEMSRTGFQGRKLSEICDIFEEMIGEKDLTILMGYAGSLSVAGQWSIVSWLIEQRISISLSQNGANLTEELSRAWAAPSIRERTISTRIPGQGRFIR